MFLPVILPRNTRPEYYVYTRGPFRSSSAQPCRKSSRSSLKRRRRFCRNAFKAYPPPLPRETRDPLPPSAKDGTRNHPSTLMQVVGSLAPLPWDFGEFRLSLGERDWELHSMDRLECDATHLSHLPEVRAVHLDPALFLNFSSNIVIYKLKFHTDVMQPRTSRTDLQNTIQHPRSSPTSPPNLHAPSASSPPPTASAASSPPSSSAPESY